MQCSRYAKDGQGDGGNVARAMNMRQAVGAPVSLHAKRGVQRGIKIACCILISTSDFRIALSAVGPRADMTH